MIRKAPTSMRVLIAGAICIAILAVLLVGHAWPLWTGQTVVLPVRPVDPRDLFRGEYVRLDTPIAAVGITKASAAAQGDVLPIIGEWPFERAGGRLVFVQLEPRAGATPANAAAEYRAVSISARPVPGTINLRGRVQWADRTQEASGIERVRIQYGLDAFYMQEGTARAVEDAIRSGRPVQMEVAIGASGRARIRNLIVEGKPLAR